MKDWIPLVAAFLGFLAGFAGPWLTQRSNRQIEADRREHEQKQAKAADQKQLFIDIVEYVEERAAWLRTLEWFDSDHEPAKLSLHPSQLAGRVKLSAPYWVSVAWDDFDRKLAEVDGDIRLGNFHPHGDLPHIMELDDSMAVPRALVAGEILVAAVRAAHEQESFSDCIDDLTTRLDHQPDRRLIAVITEWKKSAETKDSRWYGSLAGHPRALARSSRDAEQRERAGAVTGVMPVGGGDVDNPVRT